MHYPVIQTFFELLSCCKGPDNGYPPKPVGPCHNIPSLLKHSLVFCSQGHKDSTVLKFAIPLPT